MNLAEKILLGIFGFEPLAFDKESKQIQYLIDCDKIGFARWCLFMEKQIDDFKRFTDDELIEMYTKEREEMNKSRGIHPT